MATARDHVDVLVVGAGLSGIGAACQLQERHPDLEVTVLEARDAIGGTWDLFRYPGIRSDSDMFTLGYGFRPWDGEKSIADGDDIRQYVVDTAREYGVDQRIRFHHRVTAMAWDSGTARWHVTAERSDTGETVELTASFVHSCTGYYRYDEGFQPEFPGMDDFAGTWIHPQHWPEALDLADQRVVVIGSGATAVTLVPNIARQAGHVTMLQRSPSYIASLPDTDAIADLARRLLPATVAHEIIKWKNVAMASGVYELSRRAPGVAKKLLRTMLERQLPEHVDADEHFTPAYDPWDQRLCLVPNGDLFQALRDGSASMATDHIERITANGIQLRSGDHLDADVIVSATGLNLLFLGGMDIAVDGEEIDLADTIAYKGMMLSGLPNLTITIGYTNASWTLKADLVTDYLCRLLDRLKADGPDAIVTPIRPDTDELRPLIDLDSGYVQRARHLIPKQADRAPWRLHQNYVRDLLMFRRGSIDDEGVAFSRASETADPREPAVVG